MTRLTRLSLLCNWLVIFSLIGSPLAEAGRTTRPAAVQASDPHALVEELYGPDESRAQAAAAALLTGAGIPLVSIDGPVTALPSGWVLADAAIYAELLPDLVRSVRQGDFYTPAQVAELLYAAGYPEDALTAEVLVAGLGQWGKDPEAEPESRFAGAAVRALSGRRLQVLYRSADLEQVDLDPLQTVLVLAHASSRARPAMPNQSGMGGSPLAKLFSARPVQAQAAGDCDALDKLLTPSDQVKELVWQYTKGGIVDAWKEFVLGEVGKEKLDKHLDFYSKGADVLNMLILLMGAQIDIRDNHSARTHFKHKAGDRSDHVKVEALAYFDSAIAKQKVSCYKLAGINVPPPGPLKDFKIRWSLVQSIGENYQGKYLTAVQSDSQKIGGCGTCGETTGADGRSSVELYPPVEKDPGKGNEVYGMVRVTASLDKNDFPFKLSDLLGLTNVQKAAFDKIWEIAMLALQRAGLPSKSHRIRVDYHGAEIYIARGKTNLFLFYVTAPMELDVYTCEGLNGTWQGRGGLGGDTKTFLGSAAESVFGVAVPENVSYMNENLRFKIDPEAVESVFDIVPEAKITGELRLKPALIAAQKAVVVGDRVGQPVGEVEVMINNTSLAPLSFLGSTTMPLYRMPADPRCPQGGYYFESIP